MYVTTAVGDSGSKKFGLTLSCGEQMSSKQRAYAVSYIQTMYTGVYTDIKSLFADDDKSFSKKLNEKQDALKCCYTEW